MDIEGMKNTYFNLSRHIYHGRGKHTLTQPFQLVSRSMILSSPLTDSHVFLPLLLLRVHQKLSLVVLLMYCLISDSVLHKRLKYSSECRFQWRSSDSGLTLLHWPFAPITAKSAGSPAEFAGLVTLTS